MRILPRTARQRWGAATAACALVVGVVAVPLANADDLKDKQNQVDKKITSAHHDLDESSARLRRATIRLREAQTQLSGAQSRLAEVRGRLTAAQARDRQMQAKLDRAINRLAQARVELEVGRQQVIGQQAQVADVVSSIYQEGDPELLAFASILDAEDPADLTRSMEARNVLVGRETRAYDELRATEVLLVVQENEVEEARNDVAIQRREAAAHLESMQALEEEAEAATARVRTLVRRNESAQRAADRARRADRVVLRELEREANRIEDMLRRRAAAARRRAAVASRGRSAVPRASGGFLNPPVQGAVTSSFGMRTHPIYGYRSLHDGIDFGAGCGSPLYSATAGRVVSSYYQTAWGNRLIVDNGYARGVGLATIYNHATRYVVGVGEQVERGQVIGYVGTTGWSTGCHLHFSVMANGTPVDPANWL